MILRPPRDGVFTISRNCEKHEMQKCSFPIQTASRTFALFTCLSHFIDLWKTPQKGWFYHVQNGPFWGTYFDTLFGVISWWYTYLRYRGGPSSNTQCRPFGWYNTLMVWVPPRIVVMTGFWTLQNDQKSWPKNTFFWVFPILLIFDETRKTRFAFFRVPSISKVLKSAPF